MLLTGVIWHGVMTCGGPLHMRQGTTGWNFSDDYQRVSRDLVRGVNYKFKIPVFHITHKWPNCWLYWLHWNCLFHLHIIIITIIIISFMRGIYTYIPETNCVPREYIVAAILLLLFLVLISLVSVLDLLYFYISTFRSMCTVPNMTVFCSSLTSCFPGTLLTYFLNDFEIVPVTPIITGITFVFNSTCAVFYCKVFIF